MNQTPVLMLCAALALSAALLTDSTATPGVLLAAQEPQPPADPPWFAGALRAGTDGVGAPRLLKKVDPTLPEIHLDARVEADGTVSNARVVRSIQNMDAAAEAAAKQWRFAPAQQDGEAVPVIVRLVLSFD